MLYDILPPLIFFFSLGGILLLVGRVTLRMRRADVQTSLTAVAQAPTAVLSGSPSVVAKLTGATQDMKTLLQPSQKGVQVVKNRMSLLMGSVKESGQAAASQLRDLPAKIKEKPWKKAVVDPAEEVLAPAVTNQVVAPTEADRLSGRLRQFGEKLKTQGQSGLGTLKQKLAERQERRAQMKAEQARLETIEPVAAPTPAVVAPKVSLRRTMAKTAAKLTKPAVSEITSGERLSVVQPRSSITTTGPLGQVQELVAQQAYQQAEDVLLPYIVKNPKDTSAYLLLGEIALKREAWDEAQEIYEQVLRLDPKTKGAYAGLGLAAYSAGNFTKALQMLQRALDEDPTNRDILEKVLGLAQKLDNRALQHSIEEQLLEVTRKEAKTAVRV